MSRGLFEYEDYVAAPTQGNASEFITRALEDNTDQISKRENYVDYIASRPRAQRRGSHALFTDTDDPLVLSQTADAVAHHPGNIWLPIISLRREDAARLGYDDAAQWRELLTGFAPEMAEAMKIPVEQFRWYAAFHDEAHHPHLHMVCFSADGKSGYGLHSRSYLGCEGRFGGARQCLRDGTPNSGGYASGYSDCGGENASLVEARPFPVPKFCQGPELALLLRWARKIFCDRS